MLLGRDFLQHWGQFKSQATEIPILGVDQENEDEAETEGNVGNKDSGKEAAEIISEIYKNAIKKLHRLFY
eukprot:6032813-Ditylum_brightwellii.AAC.1